MSLQGIERWHPENWVGREDEFKREILADTFKTARFTALIWILGIAGITTGVITLVGSICLEC